MKHIRDTRYLAEQLSAKRQRPRWIVRPAGWLLTGSKSGWSGEDDGLRRCRKMVFRPLLGFLVDQHGLLPSAWRLVGAVDTA